MKNHIGYDQVKENYDYLYGKVENKKRIVINIQVSDKELMERITGRRVHPESNRNYHIKYNPPKVPDIDDVTGEPLVIRSTDTPENAAKRLKDYHEGAKPKIVEYARQKGILLEIDGKQPIAKVTKDLEDYFNQFLV